MAFIFRRTKQRYQQGNDGVLSNAQAQVTGTAGQCFNANTGTNNGDRNKFYTTERTFTSSDLGRYIQLSGSPPTAAATGIGNNRHDSVPFRIIEVITANLIRLEGATFQDAGTSISWTLMAAVQFTSSSATFPANSISGAGPVVNQSISLPNPVSTQRELKLVPWIVGRRIDATNLLISDWTGLVTTFPTASSLSWFLHDRQALNRYDLGIMILRFMLAAGWSTLGSQATGSVIIPAGGQSAIADGKVVRIWDGTQKLIFEFNTGSAGAGHILVPMTASDSQATVLASFVSTVNSQSGFKITAVNNGTTTINASTTAGKAVLYATAANNDTSDTQHPFNVIASFAPANGGDETVGVAPYTVFTNPNLSADVNDPITTDTVTPFVVAGMSGGQHRGQYRGRQLNGGAFGNERDVIYFSEGEAGSDGSNPKRMWARIVEVEGYTHVSSVDTAVLGFDFAMWQGWSPEFSNGASVTVGNGINPCRTSSSGTSNGFARHATVNNSVDNVGPCWGPNSANQSCFNSSESVADLNVLRIRGGGLSTHDYVFCGDKDEVHLMVMIETVGANWQSFGAIQEVQQNSRRFVLRTAVTSGSNKVLNIGPVNPQALSPPYQIGDVIQIAGTQVLSGAPVGGERVETATITAFGTTGTDNLDYTITVNALSGASYAIGTMVGEEAMPIFTDIGPHGTTFGSTNELLFGNSSQANIATHLDYSGGVSSSAITSQTLMGFLGVGGLGTLGTNTPVDVAPNRRGGRWGIVPLVLRNTANGEFRGRLRYFFYVPPRLANWQWVEDRNGNWYMVVPEILRQGTSIKPALGPVSVSLAKPYP